MWAGAATCRNAGADRSPQCITYDVQSATTAQPTAVALTTKLRACFAAPHHATRRVPEGRRKPSVARSRALGRIAGAVSRTIGFLIRNIGTRTRTIGTLIRNIGTRTRTIGTLIRIIGTRTCTIGTLIRNIGNRTCTIGTLIRIIGTRTCTIGTLIRVIGTRIRIIDPLDRVIGTTGPHRRYTHPPPLYPCIRMRAMPRAWIGWCVRRHFVNASSPAATTTKPTRSAVSRS